MQSDQRIAALEFVGTEKRFGSTRALAGLDLRIEQGEVHALVGENGAGKSTALGLAGGRLVPSRGSVRIFGEESISDPRIARDCGVISIYQELTILPEMSAEENVFLGSPLTRSIWVSRNKLRATYTDLADRLGVRAWPRVRAGDLSVGDQQLLEIMRGVVNNARIILFDEPSAALAPTEKEVLFRLIGDLKRDGVTIVLVSHDLNEVLSLADTVSVFRDGNLVATKNKADWTKTALIDAMLGRSLQAEVANLRKETLEVGPETVDDAVLRVRGLVVPGSLTGIDLDLRNGEVLGLAGLMGSGRTTVLRALAGLERRATGRLWIDGVEHPWPRTVQKARALGIALIPEDRKTQGLAMQMSSAANIALASLRTVGGAGFLTSKRVQGAVRDSAQRAGLPESMLEKRAGTLSGGNQQKLLMARWLLAKPRVLLADEPTRGIDVGVKAEILKLLRELSTTGTGVVIVSSDLEEVDAVADEILVLARGKQVGTLRKGRDATSPDAMLKLAFEIDGDAA